MGKNIVRDAERKLTKPVSKTKEVTEDLFGIEQIVTQLSEVKARKKAIEARENELKIQLGKRLEAEGSKDSKGSYKMRVGDLIAVKEARKSVKLHKERAEEFFRSRNLWADVTETIEVINEDYVEQALLNEKFTMDELEKISEIKTSYAIVLREYKPEEEEQDG